MTTSEADGGHTGPPRRDSTSSKDPPESHEPADAAAPTNTRHRCFLCSRTYERADHLHRHLKSHENERSYRCHECGKGFNRADLLNRHKAAHTKNASELLRKRTGRACQPCIKAKTKCDESRPCKRCRSRGVSCEESEGRRQSVAKPAASRKKSSGDDSGPDPPSLELPDMTPPQHYDRRQSQGQAQIPLHELQPPYFHPQQPPHNSSMMPPPPPHMAASQPFEDANLLLGLNNGNTPGMASYANMSHEMRPPEVPSSTPIFPDFFEHVMLMPGIEMGQQPPAMLPPDVSNITSDLTFDDCDFDFSFLESGLTRPSTPHGPKTGESYPASDQTAQSDAQLRTEAFQKNPFAWNDWIPERNHTSFSGLGPIDVHHDRVNKSDQFTSPAGLTVSHCELSTGDRDRMVRLVAQIGRDQLSMPSFPSLELLEDLIDVFLLQDSSSIDSYFHAATFKAEDIISELLVAVVSAGAQMIALPQVWKMGLVLQEVVRLAIPELIHRDNANTRQLQPLQVNMLMLDVGAWCGFRRKTEIAVSFLQPPVTMLSWDNAFRKYKYADVVPLAEDSDEVLHDKWRAWAARESKKRLILHMFLHDAQVAMVGSKNPLISPSQLLMPLPASRELWLAPNAQAWRHTFLRIRPPSQEDTPTLVDFFGQTTMIDRFDSVYDKSLCLLVSCHGLGHEVWQFRTQARLLARWANPGRRDRLLDHQRAQRDLEEDLAALQAHCELQTNSAPEVMMTLELLMMALHVDHDDVETFSGKLGEDEARKVFPKILAWSGSTESRLAVWHAGQVLRVARLFEKTRLRGFYAVALYHAALTLWVYGLLTNAARKSGRQTPTNLTFSAGSIGAPSPVVLNAINDKGGRAFKLLGQGTVGLQNLEGQFVALSDCAGLMVTAEAILKDNFPHRRNGLPPLVQNLTGLMAELGRLS